MASKAAALGKKGLRGVEIKFSIGTAIRDRREYLRLTQDEVAATAGITRPTIAALEAGSGRLPSLVAVLGVLGLKLAGHDRLINARRRRGWTIAQAAAQARLTAPTVRALERGTGTLASLIALGEALGVRVRVMPLSPRFSADGGARRSSASVEWYTPQAVISGVLWAADLITFDLDPASPGPALTYVPARKYLTSEDDGLSATWSGTVYLNPPYGGGVIAAWTQKAVHEAGRGAQIVALLPASTDTVWWDEHIVRSGASIVYLTGRISFISPAGAKSGAKSGATFGSAIVLWNFAPEVTERLKSLPKGWTRECIDYAVREPRYTKAA